MKTVNMYEWGDRLMPSDLAVTNGVLKPSDRAMFIKYRPEARMSVLRIGKATIECYSEDFWMIEK